MARPGLDRFRSRDRARTGLYSFERRAMRPAPALERRFRADRRAWEHFQSRPPGYRRTTIFWVMSARREETRARRLAILIACSARGRSIPGLERS